MYVSHWFETLITRCFFRDEDKGISRKDEKYTDDNSLTFKLISGYFMIFLIIKSLFLKILQKIRQKICRFSPPTFQRNPFQRFLQIYVWESQTPSFFFACTRLKRALWKDQGCWSFPEIILQIFKFEFRTFRVTFSEIIILKLRS